MRVRKRESQRTRERKREREREREREKQTPVAPIQSRLLALPERNRLGWKGFTGTNALAYFIFSSSLLANKKGLITGNTEGGSITVPLTSCLTGLDKCVLQIKTKIVSCYTADSKPVKQEVNCTVILPPLVFPAYNFRHLVGLVRQVFWQSSMQVQLPPKADPLSPESPRQIMTLVPGTIVN